MLDRYDENEMFNAGERNQVQFLNMLNRVQL